MTSIVRARILTLFLHVVLVLSVSAVQAAGLISKLHVGTLRYAREGFSSRMLSSHVNSLQVQSSDPRIDELLVGCYDEFAAGRYSMSMSLSDSITNANRAAMLDTVIRAFKFYAMSKDSGRASVFYRFDSGTTKRTASAVFFDLERAIYARREQYAAFLESLDTIILRKKIRDHEREYYFGTVSPLDQPTLLPAAARMLCAVVTADSFDESKCFKLEELAAYYFLEFFWRKYSCTYPK